MLIKDFIEKWADNDIDVYDNVCEELGIAFCGGIKLTKAGKQEFAEVLNYTIDVNDDPRYPVAIVDVDGPEGVWQKKLKAAKKFFYAAAGYCNEADYNKWFREV